MKVQSLFSACLLVAICGWLLMAFAKSSAKETAQSLLNENGLSNVKVEDVAIPWTSLVSSKSEITFILVSGGDHFSIDATVLGSFVTSYMLEISGVELLKLHGRSLLSEILKEPGSGEKETAVDAPARIERPAAREAAQGPQADIPSLQGSQPTPTPYHERSTARESNSVSWITDN